MNNIPLIGYTTFCLYISWLTIGLIHFFGCYERWCYENSYASFCLNVCFQLSWVYLGVELLYYIVILFYFLRNCQTVFHSDFNILQPFENVWELQFLINTFCFLFLFLISSECEVHIITVCICISLMIMIFSFFSCASWPTAELLWRNVHSVSLSKF